MRALHFECAKLFVKVPIIAFWNICLHTILQEWAFMCDIFYKCEITCRFIFLKVVTGTSMIGFPNNSLIFVHYGKYRVLDDDFRHIKLFAGNFLKTQNQNFCFQIFYFLSENVRNWQYYIAKIFETTCFVSLKKCMTEKFQSKEWWLKIHRSYLL